MKDAVTKAAILMEALPYIKEHAGKTVVIKYGGKAMIGEDLKEMITSDVVWMKYVGMKPVVIHGGGPEITKYMEEVGKEVKFVEGLRVTDDETMDIVKNVLVGKVNKGLVSLINQHGQLAVSVSGDGGLIRARKKEAPVDLGLVGVVERIEPSLLTDLIDKDYVPVVASLGIGKDGQSYNINADHVAGEIAASLQTDKIIFLTDVAGLYRDFSDKNSLISELTLKECVEMIEGKLISEGMLPKVQGCISALKGGVNRAHILDGTIPHALLLEVFTREGVGTMIAK